MDRIDPIEFHDDAEVAVPEEVVWGWRDAGTQEHALLHLLPSLSPPRQAPCDDAPRRKRSAVASFLHGIKDSLSGAAESPPDDPDDQTPPILAVLDAVSPSPQRRVDSARPPPTLAPLADRDVSTFHFAVGNSRLQPSPPRRSPDASPLDLRTELLDTTPDSQSPSPRSTRTSDVCGLEALRVPADRRGSSNQRGPEIRRSNPRSCSSSRVDAEGLGAAAPSREDAAARTPLPPIAAHRKLEAAARPPSIADCAVCGRALDAPDVGGVVVLDPALAVHRTCFQCANCREPLTLANFHEINPPTDQQAGLRQYACTTHHIERLAAR